jgi:hypothetical protein
MNILPNLQVNIYNYDVPRHRLVPNDRQELQLLVEYELPTQGLRIEDLNQHTTLEAYRGESESSCSICRSAYILHEIIRKLNNCQHYFHQKCVDAWLNRNTTCPMCRVQILNQN